MTTSFNDIARNDNNKPWTDKERTLPIYLSDGCNTYQILSMYKSDDNKKIWIDIEMCQPNCKHCDREIVPEYVFCPFCGADLREDV